MTDDTVTILLLIATLLLAVYVAVVTVSSKSSENMCREMAILMSIEFRYVTKDGCMMRNNEGVYYQIKMTR